MNVNAPGMLWIAETPPLGATFVLSGFLGGFATQNDRATLTATFKDGGGGTLAIASIGPVTNVDRGNVTGLLFRTTSGSVPAGTRTVDLLLTLTRAAGFSNDGYADNLSLVLTGGDDDDDGDDD